MERSAAASLVEGLVSVVIPAHDAAATLDEAIASVAAQTYPDWELLVVDDASTDSTPDVAMRFASTDPRIRLVRRTARGGPARARNEGLLHARGRYVAFLDADDWWLPPKLERQLGCIRDTGAGLVYTACRRTDAAGRPSARPMRVPLQVSYGELLGNNVIVTSTVLVDRARVGAFTMPLVRHEDFACWLSLLRRGVPAFGVQDDLARHRVSKGSVSSSKLRSAIWVWRVYRRSEHLPLHAAALHFVRYVAHAVRKRLTV
jgi:teichuronic acid biosynthesis glycosyltransferase TuaG